ncbi:MAG: RDD family protein [Pseudomonadota bacterium]|jgi:uncharacterized RDD family membrane protein YckC
MARQAIPEAASLRRRLAAMLYESLLILGVLSLTFVAPYVLIGLVWGVAVPGWVEWAHIFVVLAPYFGWFWRHGGQTLAMQTWRIKVVDAATGGAVTWRRALLRYALAWPSLVFLGAGLVWALFDRDRQFLHDRLVGTRVIRVPSIA